MRDFKLVQTGRCFQVKYLADQHMPYCCTIIIIITTIIEVCKASTPLLKEFCVCVCAHFISVVGGFQTIYNWGLMISRTLFTKDNRCQ